MMQIALSFITRATLLLIIAASISPTCQGSKTTPSVATHSGYLTFFLDNDLFAGTDENYTNGARISYVTAGAPVIEIPFIQKNLERFSGNDQGSSLLQRIWGFEDPSAAQYSYGFALTQLMFTPENKISPVAPPKERPYAGWTGIGFSLHCHDNRALNTVEISIGVVGPHAQAQATQDFIHNLRNIDKFRGWDSQIPNELTVNLHFEQKRRWTDLRKINLPFNLEIDGFHETGYAIGNQITEAHVGFLMRVGWNLPIEFSDARITPTAHTQKLFSGESYNKKNWSFYMLAGTRLTGVLHDITIDGPVFRNFDTGVTREPWVGEVYAGFGVRYVGWEFNFVQTFRSKQFESQRKNQSFGSIAIRKRF
ncbi:MAG TPA: hypothetical protein DHV60_06505 [Verrucomicrobiales bacterium]|jgi:hypothetical protein|nr:hypothetical protein [Verrucomicrobiales bacterium]